jgi:signal transduction histidine kinase
VVSASQDGERIAFVVRDTGPGIEPADLPHIYEPFWRGADAAERHIEGSGLGLALVRTLVERLGGELATETSVGSGTTFRVLLPRAVER